jgi:phosphohistidine phosphatase
VKTVYLLRHAKSSWDDPNLDDFERPLAPRGRKAAPRMGRYLSEEELIPKIVLCSGARRARETWELVQGAMEAEIPVRFLPEIYHGSSGTLKDLVHHLPEELDSVLLIGHNPTFQHLALSLAGSGDQGSLSQLQRKYPTGALAVLVFQGEKWSVVREGAGHLRRFVRPKSL